MQLYAYLKIFCFSITFFFQFINSLKQLSINMITLIKIVQIPIECETQESEAGHTKHLNLY